MIAAHKRRWICMAFVLLLVGEVLSGEFVREVPFIPGQGLPEAKRNGEVWCLYQYPATTRKVEDAKESEVEVRPAIEVVVPVPAEYGTEEFEVVVEPAHQAARITGMKFESERKEYEVRPAHFPGAVFVDAELDIITIPAREETSWLTATFTEEEVEIVIASERREWKKLTSSDGVPTDCYQWIALPAKTEKMRIKKLVKEGRVTSIKRPAETQTVKIQKLVRDGEDKGNRVTALMASVECKVPVPKSQLVNIVDVPEKVVTLRREKIIKRSFFRAEQLPALIQKLNGEVVTEPARVVWRQRSEGQDDF